jgi:hypothetical protein
VSVAPNPFTGSTRIRWLPEGVRAIRITDALGREIARADPRAGEWVFRSGSLPSGSYRLGLDGRNGRESIPVMIVR